MYDQATLDLFINARLEPDDVLVLGENSEALAADIKTLFGERTVMALRTTSVESAVPGAPMDLGTSVHVVQGQPTQLQRRFVGAFGYVICSGPSTLLDASSLPLLLRLWRTYLKDTGRIVLRMYAAPGQRGDDWRAMETRYRDAGERSGCGRYVPNCSGSGCGLYETNGLYSGDVDFGIDGTDVRWLRGSIEDIAARIQTANTVEGNRQASMLRCRAAQLTRYGLRPLTEAERDVLVRGNSARGVFYATFRRE